MDQNSPYRQNARFARDHVPLGSGGEPRQTESPAQEGLTTQQGVPVSDNQNSLKVGGRGPTLLEDFHLREKIFHFDHERIPERVVHARGYGARGYFECYDSLADLTRAAPFSDKGKKTPVFTRFSTVAGNQGSPDLARDVRGFAVKFYTEEGNWDLVGNNIPVFFIQDALKFPDLIHAAKQEPDRGFPQAQTAHDNFWDFISLSPESMHMVMWIMSDRTIPRSFRFMEGFGVHTFRFVNVDGNSSYVKFHWKPKLGMQSVVWNEALKVNGADPDFHRRDLWDAIEAQQYPEWELGLQVFDDEFAERFEFDILDATKLIPEEQVPVRRVGRMVLTENVDNFFQETEQVAFCTQNVVPGIDFTNDPLLQGRNFSYLDTQLKRLGSPNFTKIPVNAPRCPVRHFQQDGQMSTANPKGRVNYEPNSWSQDVDNPRETTRGYVTHPRQVEGVTERVRSETFADHYSQARQFYISQTPVERTHIADALVFELSKVETPRIRERMVAHLRNVDDSLASEVAAQVAVYPLPEPATPARTPRTDLPESPALSIVKNGPSRFEGRKVGVLASEGTSCSAFQHVQAAAKREGASLEVVGPRIGPLQATDGVQLTAKENVDGGPSVRYDALAVMPSESEAKALAQRHSAVDFVSDAYAHGKFIGYTESALPLVQAAGIPLGADSGMFKLDSKEQAEAFLQACRQLRHWERGA